MFDDLAVFQPEASTIASPNLFGLKLDVDMSITKSPSAKTRLTSLEVRDCFSGPAQRAKSSIPSLLLGLLLDEMRPEMAAASVVFDRFKAT